MRNVLQYFIKIKIFHFVSKTYKFRVTTSILIIESFMNFAYYTLFCIHVFKIYRAALFTSIIGNR